MNNQETSLINKQLSTPILFLIFNRPDLTHRVFKSIKEAKPKRLYIAADGPFSNNKFEKKLCYESRKIIKSIDWECELKTLFKEKNLGCKIAVSQAIEWFFDHEKEGIILEDDCLPTQSFFLFCQDLLDKYRYEDKIGAICGFYSNEMDYQPKQSYFMSRYLRVWGWAGWRRTFEDYESNLKFLIEKNNTWEKDIFSNNDFLLKKYWQEMFKEVACERINTWDVQLQYLLWKKKQYVLVPTKNLIKNIGWSNGAHSQNKDHNHDIHTSEIGFPLDHLEILIRDTLADKFIEKKSYRITKFAFLKKYLIEMLK